MANVVESFLATLTECRRQEGVVLLLGVDDGEVPAVEVVHAVLPSSVPPVAAALGHVVAGDVAADSVEALPAGREVLH